jgi:hypothetical protein
MARAWRRALARFLKDVPFRRDVVGALVCGSFVTGDPGPRSDIDLHLVLAPRTRWRERGNRVIDGIVVEYFANPPRQIRAYFRHDHRDNRRMAPTQVASGRVLFDDRRGTVRRLVAEARAWERRPLARVAAAWVEQTKYALYDQLDDLEDAIARRAADVPFLYHLLVAAVAERQARFAREPAAGPAKLYRLLTSARARGKYRAAPLRDARHAQLLAAAIRERDPARMPDRARALVSHVLEEMGGFGLDGWRLRSGLST